MIQVYTGNGKGKTTASLGLAIRALGQGMRVCIIQFLKHPKNAYGEHKVLNALKDLGASISIEQYGAPHFVFKGKVKDSDIELAHKGLDRAKEVIEGNDFDIVILDEINVAVELGVLKKEELLGLLDLDRGEKEVLFTGRYAPKELIDRADLVTEMCEVKHYYTQGVQARKGIEF